MARIAITARIDALLMQRNITKTKFYEDCGITSASYSQWNTGKTTPRMKNIVRIAEYLKVSPEYLMTGDETKKEPTADNNSELNYDDAELLNAFKKADENIQELIRRTLGLK